MVEISIPEKQCTKCGEYKSATTEYFHKDKSKPDGLYSSCKLCVLERVDKWRERSGYDKKRYWDNRESEIARNKEYHKRTHIPKVKPPPKTKEYYALYKKEWYEAHKEETLAKHKSDYRANPDKYTAKGRLYRLTHRIEVRASKSAYKARRRSRIKDTGGKVTSKDVSIQYKSQKGLCWWCEISVGDDYHVDHLTPLARGGGHNPNNIVISCPKCNCSRQEKMPYEWSDRLL